MLTLQQQPSESTFYLNAVLVEDFDYTIVAEPERLRIDRAQRQSIVSKVGRSVATLVAGGIFVFGPVGITAPPHHTPDAGAVIERVVVRVLAPGVSEVPIPAVHQQAAARFRKLFRAVPLNDVEKMADPDYGL